MRLFVGLALSEEAKQRLERLTLRLRAPEDGLRWTSAEQWHITLVFLATVEDKERALLLREWGRIHAVAVAVRIEGLGTFDRTGILYAAVEVSPELLHLQQRVAEAARVSGLEAEDRAYRPHITLARSRNREGLRTLQRLKPALEKQRLRVDWRAEEVLMYESQLSPSGSRYLVRERFALSEDDCGG
ncbi:MAG TPA: RNA 2',3'-cyclic phosphodiesterase [Acidobacteriaceae bacterium]